MFPRVDVFLTLVWSPPIDAVPDVISNAQSVVYSLFLLRLTVGSNQTCLLWLRVTKHNLTNSDKDSKNTSYNILNMIWRLLMPKSAFPLPCPFRSPHL